MVRDKKNKNSDTDSRDSRNRKSGKRSHSCTAVARD